ncbi:MAG: nitrogenase iron-molybdenum cofactor biosynthesis protein NifN [Methylohalobius sp.]|nr:nitrogenase iron-molybdenum cofactor biosynthesis protein NifN [Methylohalobius sp.]
MSQPLGAALAFLGMADAMPLFHGSQGCTSFGLVLLVRHFREAIPLQTTAMNEVATVLGGLENLEQALVNLKQRANPALIGVCSTGVTEIKGDDVEGYLKLILNRHPELAETQIVYVSTPDFKGAFQDGWSRAVTKLLEQLAEPGRCIPNQVNLLPGCHLTPGDVEELREIIEAFGLKALVIPDLSGSLDGHVPKMEEFKPTTLGGTTLGEIRASGCSILTLAVGEQMRPAAEALKAKTGVPYVLFDRLTGLIPNDEFTQCLSEVSKMPVPAKYQRQRSQLVDAMLDGHFYFGGKRVAIGAEPDLLWAIGMFLSEMGADIGRAVTTTYSPVLEKLPVEEVVIGDLEDLEAGAVGCDLLLTHSHGRQAAARLGIPLFRLGLPMFDRLGAAHQLSVGYRGTRDLIFALGNLFLEHSCEPTPETWRHHVGAQTEAG